jgi:hypothetical protein
MNNREQLPQFLNDNGLTGKGVEVGVEFGYFSDLLLKGSDLHILFSVDSWCEYSDYENGQVDKSQEKHDESMQCAVRTLWPYGPRSKILRLPSVEAAKLFNFEELDFVYIDAAHSYQSCMNDIVSWYPKVRTGGILAGHDYQNDNFGAKQAVDEFAAGHSIDLNVIVDGSPSWWFWVNHD